MGHPLLEETKWALYTSNGLAKNAQSDQCESCHQLWQKGWPQLTWANFCSQVHDEPSMAQVTTKAREILEGHAKHTAAQEQVNIERMVSLQVERSWIILNERELRRALNVPRVTKAQTRGIPTLAVPSEDGGSEQVYVFEDDQAPYRRARVSITYGAKSDVQEMPLQSTLFVGQGNNVQASEVAKQWKSSGVADILAKEANGHLKLQGLQGWLADAMNSQNDVVPEPEGAQAPVAATAPEPGDEVQFEGVAAQLIEDSPVTPSVQAKKKPAKPGDGLTRGASMSSVFGGPDDGDRAAGSDKPPSSSIDGSTMGDVEEGAWA